MGRHRARAHLDRVRPLLLAPAVPAAARMGQRLGWRFRRWRWRWIRGRRILRWRWIVWRRRRLGELVAMRLSSADRARIQAALQAAQARTHARFALMIVPASDRYAM